MSKDDAWSPGNVMYNEALFPFTRFLNFFNSVITLGLKLSLIG